MCNAALQIHRGEGGGSHVHLCTRGVQGPRCCSSAVTGNTALPPYLTHFIHPINTKQSHTLYIIWYHVLTFLLLCSRLPWTSWLKKTSGLTSPVGTLTNTLTITHFGPIKILSSHDASGEATPTQQEPHVLSLSYRGQKEDRKQQT